MAHRHPDYPYFTHEICKRGILQEPFRLLDIGVRGGIANHWLNFGDHLHAWGFDVLHESVAPLIEANGHPERLHYFNIGLGEQDTTRAFRFYPDNPWSSHFAASNGTDQTDESWQNVPIRRLDSLYAEGTIGLIDFMKVDAESYEIEIVKGAREFFRNSGIFGVEAETQFQRTPAYPRSHFVELYEELAPHEFSVCDAGLQRLPRRPLAHGFPNEATPGEYVLQPIGAAWVFDFLFLNDIFENTAKQSAASPDRLLKMIAVAEIYGLQDIGLDILFGNRERLGNLFDVEQGADWLIRQHPGTKLTYQQYLAGVNKSCQVGFPDAKPDGSHESLLKPKLIEVENLLAEHKRLLCEKDVLLAQEQRKLAQSNAALDILIKSRSWRLTAPLRRAMTWLRR